MTGFKCEDCKYFEQCNKFLGWCRRNPPTILLTEDRFGDGVWPNVSQEDWCGEFVEEPE